MNRMETLRSLYSPAGQEYLQDPEVTAVGFEENIFTAATSQVYMSVCRLKPTFMYH